MTKILSALFLSLFLVGCTSDEGTLKKLSLEMAQKKFQENLKKEAEEGLAQSEWLQGAYVDFMQAKSEVEVDEVKLHSSTLATVSTTVTTYPTNFRRTLLGIARGVGRDKSRRFSFSEAVPLVAEQMGASSEPQKQPFEIYKFSKQSDRWTAQ